MVRAAFELGGATCVTGDGYPGWKPNPSSAILKVAVESYKRLFGVEPKVKAIHAGLECGLFLENIRRWTWFLSDRRCAAYIHRTSAC